MTFRISVFVDEQNMHHRAAEAFFSPGAGAINLHSSDGQFWPHQLGEQLLNEMQNENRSAVPVLSRVHVYYRLPRRVSRRAYGSKRAQVAAWKAANSDLIDPVPFTTTKRGSVKGTHTALALDVFAGAFDGDYDVGVVVSENLDLLPIFEKLRDLRGSLQANLHGAVWRAAHEPPREFADRVLDLGFPCYELDEAIYESVRDRTPYGDTAAQQGARSGRRRRRKRRAP